jgi:hypothetical protein
MTSDELDRLVRRTLGRPELDDVEGELTRTLRATLATREDEVASLRSSIESLRATLASREGEAVALRTIVNAQVETIGSLERAIKAYIAVEGAQAAIRTDDK